MKIDDLYYAHQTKIRGVINKRELIDLCENESLRIKKVLKKELDELRKSKVTVLDIPCGYGNLLHLYASIGIEAVGYDLDQNQVNLARSISLNAMVSSIENLDLVHNSFSAISSFDFLEHISKEDIPTVLNKFNNWLKPGGFLFLRMPCADSPMGLRDFAEDPTHKWIATSSCMNSLLTIFGFEDIKCYEDWPRPKKLYYLRNYVAKFLRFFLRLFLFFTGFTGYSKPLSSSMIIIARKKLNV